MDEKIFKKYYLLRIVTTTVFGLLLALALFLLSPYATEVFDILVIATGLLTAVMNLPALFLALRFIRRRGEWVNFVMSLLAVLLGVALMLLQRTFLLLLIGVYSLILPLVRIFLVSERGAQLKKEVPHFMTGAVMLVVFLAEAEAIVLRWGALVALALSVLYFLRGILTLYLRFSLQKGEK